jgi:ElaB/YqjD/DUF883 family membrane-anchored ribosome-binding protein
MFDGEKAKKAFGNGADKLQEGLEDAQRQLKNLTEAIRDKSEAVLEEIQEKGEEMLDEMRDKAGQAWNETLRRTKRNPAKAILITFACGLLAGLLIRGRRD